MQLCPLAQWVETPIAQREHWVRDVMGGREARMLRLEAHMPFVCMRPEVENSVERS
jgi:hypothetical protein